ncbi:hypothetical protein KEJ51_06435 [Candidatus Bathyarchaeota archaeon]|nr:hypothetical protein [Candidatus Bathyarchaeota archaeon]MBS7628499.1 hypothetical protein [Candidatus Bathyarchaeota archaeon]
MKGRASHISKVYIKSSRRKVGYATIDYIIESLHLMRVKDNLPVFEALNLLAEGRIDSISFSRDVPHCYFYARSHRDVISIIIRKVDEGKDIEFQIPTKTLKLAIRDPKRGV